MIPIDAEAHIIITSEAGETELLSFVETRSSSPLATLGDEVLSVRLVSSVGASVGAITGNVDDVGLCV